MFTFKSKPQSVSEILVSGLSLYWTALKTLWIWSLSLAMLNAIPAVFAAYLMKNQFGTMALVYLGLLLLLLLPAATFLSGFILYNVYLIGTQTKKNLRDVAQIVLKKLLPLMIALAVASILSWLGMFVFFVPGVFISVVLVFLAPLILLDDHGIINAYRNSFFLVWKSWWRTFSVIVIPIVLSLVDISLNMTPTFSVAKIGFFIVQMTLVVPLFYSLVLTLYYDAKLRHNLPLHLPRKKKVVKSKATNDAKS